MRRTTSLTALLLGATLLAPTGHATAVGETCRGEAATIVGAGSDITGTAGRDVIVTAEATEVDAGAGDDLICVTAPPKERGFYIDVEVDAGPGNDVVDAAGANSTRLMAILGSGADEFLGGPSQDGVVGGEMAADGSAGADVERDLIDGAGGDDALRSGTFGPEGGIATAPNADVVLGGDGADSLEVHGPLTAEGRIDGGSDRDHLRVRLDAATWEISTATGARRDSSDYSRWAGLEELSVFSSQPGVRLTINGTPGTDDLELYGSELTYAVDLGAGDDLLALSAIPSTGSSLALGEGRDVMWAYAGSTVVDLTQGIFSLAGSAPAAVSGVENVHASGRNVALTGDGEDNVLTGGPCAVTLDGRGGNDTLDRFAYDGPPLGCEGKPMVLKGGTGNDSLRASTNDDRLIGGAGNDKLESRSGDDVLRGGAGRDRLDAGSGKDRLIGNAGRDSGLGGKDRDLCSTEIRKDCER